MDTDRGSQYMSGSHRKLTDDFKMIQSMSRRSVFKTLNVELIYPQRYGTRAQVRLGLVSRMEGFYNRERMHSSIEYETPVDAE